MLLLTLKVRRVVFIDSNLHFDGPFSIGYGPKSFVWISIVEPADSISHAGALCRRAFNARFLATHYPLNKFFKTSSGSAAGEK